MDLNQQYRLLKPRLQNYAARLEEQLSELLSSHGIALAVPLERRVKALQSVTSKADRLGEKISRIEDLEDLVGLRAILLFQRDLALAEQAVRNAFVVLKDEDTGLRLAHEKFGYQSRHYVVFMPDDWLNVPTFREFKGLRAELQIRTLAQHLWAAASHKLQYKRESSVPYPIRRSIHRVAALLETVDLELERVLSERDLYLSNPRRYLGKEALNVDSLAQLLDARLPQQNRTQDEPYAELLEDLARVGVFSAKALDPIISRHLAATLEKEERELVRHREEKDYRQVDKERIESGVFFAHVGLARSILTLEFGDKWHDPDQEVPLLDKSGKKIGSYLRRAIE